MQPHELIKSFVDELCHKVLPYKYKVGVLVTTLTAGHHNCPLSFFNSNLI